jgi:Fe-S cluster assembly protein SufD
MQMTQAAALQAIEPKDHYLAQFAEAQARLPGGGLPWLQAQREAAIARFAERGFPTTREEDWKYTSVRPIEKQAFALNAPGVQAMTPASVHALGFADLPAHRLVFVNGHLDAALSQLGTLPAGVSVRSLREAIAQAPDELEGRLGEIVNFAVHPFAALNTAFIDDGAYVALRAGAVLDTPLHLLFVTTDGSIVHPRVLVVAGENSQATVIEQYVGVGDHAYFNNAITEVVASEGASIEHYKLQQEGAKGFHVAGLHVRQEKDSRFVSHSVSLGGALVRNDIAVLLAATGGECTLNGLYLASGRQHVDYHTLIDHASAHATSREFYKGVLDGRARGVFNGRVIVRQDAQKTDAQQTNRNLLLSVDAEIDTKPQLEIYADDVKCAHGATVGQLSEEAIYYLRSRGIDAATARSLLTYAFADEIIRHIPLAPIRSRLEQLLLTRLPGSERVKELL